MNTTPKSTEDHARGLVADLVKQRWRDGTPGPPVLNIPGDRATLARCLGRPFGDKTWLQAERFVVPHLPKDADTTTEQAFFLVAAMVCAQSPIGRSLDTGRAAPGKDDPPPGSLGVAMATAVMRRRILDDRAAEARLLQLANLDTAGIHRRLPTLVRFLREKRTPLRWDRLINDLSKWRRGRNETARSWMRDYHRTRLSIEADNRRRNGTDLPESEN